MREAMKSEWSEEEETGTWVSFLLMPTVFFRSVHKQFEKAVGTEEADRIMHDRGFECGELIIKRIHNYETLEELLLNISDVWIEIGLGIITFDGEENGVMTFECAESNEAKGMGLTGRSSCHFSLGYLDGMLSSVTGKSYQSVETLCVSKGDPICKFKLKIVDHKRSDSDYFD